MSQSDYIKFKKTQNKLYDLKRFPSTLDARDYTDFKQYSIETTIIGNTYQKPKLNQLIPPGKTTIFDMQVNVNCPFVSRIDPSNSFITCQNTNQRVNRVQNNFNPNNSYSFSYNVENAHTFII